MVRPLKTDHQRMCFNRPMTPKERKDKYMRRFRTKAARKALYRKWRIARLLRKITKACKEGKGFVFRRVGAPDGNRNGCKSSRRKIARPSVKV
jgi:hypothetical protein